MSEGGLDVSGTSFGWAAIDRVQYSTVDRYVNGAYLGTTWVKAVEILDERVCIRLIRDAVTTVRGGGTTEFAGLRLDPQGVHKPGLLRSRPVPWNDIAGTETRDPYLRILSRARGRVRNAIQLPQDGWNVVLVPRVVTAMTASRP